MKQWTVLLGCAVVACGAWPVLAQERIYRCGNEYTNNAAQAKERNCKVVEGGHVTVVHSGTGNTTGATPARAGTTAAPTVPRAPVDAEQQKARDNDARAILQAELNKAKARLATLQSEWNDGNPTKSALELRNPQVYNERVDALKANMARQESDIAGIERELARHSGG